MTDEPLDLTRIDRRHQPKRNASDSLVCESCNQDWPCDATRLLGRVRELEQKDR